MQDSIKDMVWYQRSMAMTIQQITHTADRTEAGARRGSRGAEGSKGNREWERCKWWE